MGCAVSFDDTSRYTLRHVIRNNMVVHCPDPVQKSFCTNSLPNGLLSQDRGGSDNFSNSFISRAPVMALGLDSEDELMCDVFGMIQPSGFKNARMGWSRRSWNLNSPHRLHTK